MLVCKVKVLAPGVISSTEASGSKPRRNTKNTRILTPRSDNKKKVKDHPRNNRSNLKQKNCVDSSISFKRTCVVKYLTSVNALPFVKDVLSTFKQVWKETGKLFVNVGYQWKPTGRKFTLGEQCPLTRLLKTYDEESLSAQEFHEKVHRDRKFCDSDLEVAFRKHLCYVRNEDSVELLKVIFMDTTYGSKGIRRIGNWSNGLSCKVLALIRHISFVGYGGFKDLHLDEIIKFAPFGITRGGFVFYVRFESKASKVNFKEGTPRNIVVFCKIEFDMDFVGDTKRDKFIGGWRG
ncbi:hypothetical protein Tco_1355146 [Tanacetum coccineum]